ncbi:MAG: prepilin-type N-terminal cleavage/methylation domain-containing protein [Candidatus Reddybacter sp.]
MSVIKKGCQQSGFSLVELMVGMTVGLVILAGAITLFAKISFSGLENTRRVQLNEQLRSALNLIHKDIQRAGYVDASDGATGVADVDVVTMSLFGSIVIGGANDCITYSYDFDGNNIQDAGEIFGFRLNGGAIERDTSAATCGIGGGGWEDFTDSGVTITALTFSDARSSEYEVSRDGNDNGACDSGETCLARRIIDVVISGHVAQEDPNDASTLVVTLRDEIKVKNDRYYTVP